MRFKMLSLAIVAIAALVGGRANAQPASQPAPWGRAMLWDGDAYNLIYQFQNGSVSPNPKDSGNAIRISTAEAHNGKQSLEMHVETGGAATATWNLLQWYPLNWGINATWADNVVFWAKVSGEQKLKGLKFGLGTSFPRASTGTVDVLKYCPGLLDGNWHEVTIPLVDLRGAGEPQMDLHKVWELHLAATGPEKSPYSLFIDEISFTGTRPDIQKEGTYWLQEGDVVMFLGDSITAEGSYYSTLFGVDLKARYPELVMNGDKVAEKTTGPKLKFINAGIHGETAGNGLARLTGLLEKYKPTACVVCFGMNDWSKDRANYTKNMTAIVKKLKDAKVAVTILTSPSTASVKNPGMEAGVKPLADLAAQALAIAQAEGVHYADCYSLTRNYQLTMLKEHPSAKEREQAEFSWGDGIHPNHMGFRCMADALEADWGYGLPLAKLGAPRPAPHYPAANATTKPSTSPAGK